MKQLKVIIVGAGIGGLQTALALAADGHKITVLESVKEFLEVGAGIRIPPNSSRLSRSWGVDLSRVKKEVSRGNRFVDWQGTPLLDCAFDDVESRYGAPYYFVHRADLIAALVDAARARANIELRMDCRAVEYDFEAPALKTSAGEWLRGADLIICADGIKSGVRDLINGAAIAPHDTGDVAYRILVPAAPLLADPTMRDLVTQPWAVHWMGPEAHAVGYPLRHGELYNIIIDTTHATDRGEPVGADEWRSRADNAELIARFADWCEPVRKLCGLTGTFLKWRLADFAQLQRWVHPSGKVALLGDACHPMMPYMAQGAAQATEDAATLRAALASCSSSSSSSSSSGDGAVDIARALKRYERQRLPRAAYVMQNTRVLQEWLHLYDGPERQRRDELMRHDDARNPIFWGCSTRRDWLFGYDARKLEGEEEVEGEEGGGGGGGEGEEKKKTLAIPELPPLPAAEASVYTAYRSLGDEG